MGLVGRLGANAALGGAYGATGAVGAGQTDVGQIGQSALGGAALGGALGGVGEAAGGLLNKFGGQNSESRLGELVSKNKTLSKSFNTNQVGETNPIKTLEQNGFSKDLRVSDGVVDASALTNEKGTGKIDELIQQHADDASSLVKGMQGGVPTEQYRNDILKAVAENPDIRDAGNVSKARAEIERRFADYKESYGDTLPWTAVDSIRKTMNKDYSLDTRDVSRTIGDTARKYLYEGSGTNVALKATMGNEAELIRARNFAEKLHGSRVKGGRLGKYVARGIGTAIGGGVGSALGPFGEGAGALLGAGIGNHLEDVAQRNYFNPILSGASKRARGVLKSAPVTAGKNLVKAGLLRSATK